MSDELLDAVRDGNVRDIDWKELVEQLERISALRLSLAQAQAREAQYRAALVLWADKSDAARRASFLGFRDESADMEHHDAADALMRIARGGAATPADDGALREFGERMWDAGFDTVPSVGALTQEERAKARAFQINEVLGGAS